MGREKDITNPDHPVTLSNDALLRECVIRRFRASGPGGQHRNKVETAVELIHESTGVSAAATERRSQIDNQRVALRRLRLRLAVEVRVVVSAEVYPSNLWKSRCRNRRIQCSERHTDFPVLLTESLNAIHAKDYDVKSAAHALGCTTSQLVRFIARVPEALMRVNSERGARGLRTLKS